MDYKSLEKIKHSLFENLEQFAKRGDVASNIKSIHEITDTIKNIDKIVMLEDGYSEGEWEAEGSYRGNSYRGEMTDGYSERRKRNRMGQYSRHSDIVEELRELMHEASSEEEKKAIKRCIDQMQ